MKKGFIAHVKLKEDGNWKEPHLLKDHLDAVAKLAGKFAEEFGNKDWTELAGYLHDLGKFHPDWQKYLCRKSGYDTEAHLEESNNRPNHSTAGSVLVFEKFNNSVAAKILAYIIGGHHSGLPDWIDQLKPRLFTEDRILNTEDLNRIKELDEAKEFLKKEIPSSPPHIFANEINDQSKEQIQLWIRMLFSCLVDADFLDTEKYMDEKERSVYETLEILKQRFNNFMLQKLSNTKLNEKRNKILQQCREKAKLAPGFFSLTVPTGGGKTLSSMAFALEHAIQNNKKRIIVAIPYTSIIEQTAKVFKYGSDIDEEIKVLKEKGEFLFGEDQVVEHHSNLDPVGENPKNRLATENWDAPIIVTTNVQLFESLFGNKTSVCRKLHNITNSIIVLDEAQMIPTHYLKPIISVLKGLVNHFGVTVILMSATQPALNGAIGSEPNIIQGFENVTEIIEDPNLLAKDFKRVEIILPEDLNKKSEWEEIVQEISQYEQALCIVNKRDDCRQLHSLMPEDTIHLSGYMCGEERSELISEIKLKLKHKQPIRVISTQLVEAGVDIDFPVVFRALTGIDSIVQAAGRCNRENKLKELGKVFVFVPPKPSPSGFLRKCEDAGKTILRYNTGAEFNPSLYSEYFKYLYSNLNTFDEADFYSRLVKDAASFDFQFRTFAEKFNLIDDKKQHSIIVWYESKKNNKNNKQLIEQLKFVGPYKDLLRQLQRYIVNVPVYIFNKINESGYVENINGYWVQKDENLYKPGLGILYDEGDWTIGNGVI